MCSTLSNSSGVAEQDKSIAAPPQLEPAGSSCEDSQQTSSACLQAVSFAPQQVSHGIGSRIVKYEDAAHHSSECAADRPQQPHPMGSLEALRCPIQACTPQPEASISAVPTTAGRQSRAPAGFYGQSWRLRDVELHVLRLLKVRHCMQRALLPTRALSCMAAAAMHCVPCNVKSTGLG